MERVAETLERDGDEHGAAYELRDMLAASPPPPPPAAEGVHAGDVSAEDVAVLHRIKAALPDIGVNGWYEGVQALERVLARLSQQPAAVDEALDRLRRENVPCLWHADLVGGRISEERMRVILTAALAANDTLAAPPAAATR